MAESERETPRRAVTEVVPLQDAWDGESTNPSQMGGVQLVCVAGQDLGRTFAVTGTSVTIGRGAVDVALHGNDVSRNHARIDLSAGEFAITDLGSSNGTCVNGKRIAGRSPLALGDRVQIGSSILVFQRHDELEARMRMLQRLEAMGTMAGGLAHDFNNALTVILGNLEHLRSHLPAGDGELRSIVDEMKDAAGSAAELAQRLLRLGRSEPQSHAMVRLGGLVDRAISTMRRQPGPKLAISAQIPSDATVVGSYEELHQVLINLYLNARDAMPDGGVFRIGARRLVLDAAAANSRQLPGAGDYVELSASDTGIGMDKDVAARIFEPFYTTKPPGQGTGLGLAMVHGIVRRHGGSIDVESIPRSGTTFRIVLPAAQ